MEGLFDAICEEIHRMTGHYPTIGRDSMGVPFTKVKEGTTYYSSTPATSLLFALKSLIEVSTFEMLEESGRV